MCQCILIPIKRLNDTSVDYIFYYKYMLSTFTYIARKKKKGAPRRAQSTRLIYLPLRSQWQVQFHLGRRSPPTAWSGHKKFSSFSLGGVWWNFEARIGEKVKEMNRWSMQVYVFWVNNWIMLWKGRGENISWVSAFVCEILKCQF